MKGRSTHSVLSLSPKIFFYYREKSEGSSGLCFKKTAFGHTSMSLNFSLDTIYAALMDFLIQYELFVRAGNFIC